MPYDFAGEAARHREMAVECRTTGELFADEGLRAQYRKLSEAYEGLAVNELRVAANLHPVMTQETPAK